MKVVIIGAIVGGIIGGLCPVFIALFSANKLCPKCSTELPKFRKPTNSHQRMWGGWTCPNCSCEIDRKGNLREI